MPGMCHVRSIFRPNLFKNKVAIVTGGATGIGKAITEELLHLGCNVTIASRNEENLAAAVKELQERVLSKDEQSRINFLLCNIRKEDQVQNLIRDTLNRHGGLDFLVNNGGGQFPCRAEDISLKGWNAVVETNLTGTFLVCKEAYTQWMQKHGGSIVNIVMENSRGYPMAGHSGAARAGVQNLTQTLAVEWAESGVRINSLEPGCIYSESAAKNYSSDLFSIVRPRLPAKRTGTPQEVSSAVCFLLSPGASYISGTSLQVDAATHLYPSLTFDIPDHNNWPQHDSSSRDMGKGDH